MENLVSYFATHLSGLISKEGIIFIISLMPVLELRGGLLAASILDVSYIRALLICIVGNLLPIPFVLLFISHIVEFLERFSVTKGIALMLRTKVEKNKKAIEKYDFWGLVLFVGIPLPGTGAWTGSLAAGLLHMNWKKAFPAIIVGILLASVIMSVISYGALGLVLRG